VSADARPKGSATRGRLRIYLGYAPGAGTTCALLNEGRRRAEHGTDVVVASAETRGRAHTEGLLAGLEVIPSAKVPYRGTLAEEMDLNEVLARGPVLALVDDFARRNAPGTRHPVRWQDVEDLLEAGIDVISTVSVGHLEPGGVQARERVMVGLSGCPEGEALIRRAARIAARSGADLLAVHAARPGRPAASGRALLAAQRRLVESAGGTYHQVAGKDIAAALLAFAHAHNATQLVLGATPRTRLAALRPAASIRSRVIRRGGGLDVHLVTCTPNANRIPDTRRDPVVSPMRPSATT
jgi:K+-sensing histidine kinase KdpD